MLQTRNGKRTAAAAMKIACDLVDEGMITEEEAVAMIDPKSLDALLHPHVRRSCPQEGKGHRHRSCRLPRRGLRQGRLHRRGPRPTGRRAVRRSSWSVWRPSPEDIEGMHYAQGVLTVRGGMTSHAAVVARGMGTCCVSGCGAIKMDEANKKFELAGKTYQGRRLDLHRRLHRQHLRRKDQDRCCRHFRRLRPPDELGGQVPRSRRSAPTPTPRTTPRRHVAFGAEGIGLCRTEHMFFEADRIKAMREMIVSETSEQREKALGQARADAAGRL